MCIAGYFLNFSFRRFCRIDTAPVSYLLVVVVNDVDIFVFTLMPVMLMPLVCAVITRIVLEASVVTQCGNMFVYFTRGEK